MKVFGITGGIGSGKSSVASALRRLGVPVVDADSLSRLAVAPGSHGMSQVVREFGMSVVREDGSLDRREMGRMAFSSVEARVKLNSIVHPIVERMAEEAFARLRSEGAEMAAYDCPLLFEAGLQERYRPTVVVFASPEEQVRRTMARDGLSEAGVRDRMASQTPLAEKARMADLVLDNSGDEGELEERVAELVGRIRKFLAQGEGVPPSKDGSDTENAASARGEPSC